MMLYTDRMFIQISRVAAWLTFAAIVFVTISPINLRPHDVLPVDVDRALAFLVMAALFTVAYPKHTLVVAATLVAGAGLIESLQYLSPTRHAHFDDALVKASGAALGVAIGVIFNKFKAARQDRPLPGG